MIEGLLKRIEGYDHVDAIVVEGYDGVGKGFVLNELSKCFRVSPYRPDYNLWQLFDHRKSDRWKVSGFFWDVYSHFSTSSNEILLFDRGVLSGAVYNNNMEIARHYKEMLRDKKVLHVLVVCSFNSYQEFYKSRNPEATEDAILRDWSKCLEYTNRYFQALSISKVDYLIHVNEYDKEVDKSICKSCGHYSYGICRHPQKNCSVDGDLERCELANEREVQDIDSEVYSMQS